MKNGTLFKFVSLAFILCRGVIYTAPSDNIDTRLINATYKGKIHKVRSLLQKGGDINCKEKNGFTLLHRAAVRGHKEIVLLLIEKGLSIDAKDDDDLTTLERMIMIDTAGKNFLDIVQILINNGATISYAGPKRYPSMDNNVTLLHFAATINRDFQKGLIKLLIDKGISIHSCSSFGRTPLHCAIAFDSLEAVQELLENGADQNYECKVENGKYESAKSFAIDLKRLRIIKLFEKQL